MLILSKLVSQTKWMLNNYNKISILMECWIFPDPVTYVICVVLLLLNLFQFLDYLEDSATYQSLKSQYQKYTQDFITMTKISSLVSLLFENYPVSKRKSFLFRVVQQQPHYVAKLSSIEAIHAANQSNFHSQLLSILFIR